VTLYTGNGGTQSIGGLEFSPDLCWIKSRTSNQWHFLCDVVRGATKNLASNDPYQEETRSNRLTSFDSNGFSTGNSGTTNESGKNFVAWFWKAGGSKNTFNVDDVGYASAAAAGLTGGSITPTGSSVGTRQGFSIIKYTGTGSNASVSHGLQNIPQFMIVKDRESNSGWWAVYHHSMGNTHALYLNDVQSKVDSSFWNDTTPTSSVFTIGANANTNSSNDFIAYLWHDVPGLQKFGSYEGNESTNGPFVELGFRPAILLVKNADEGSNDWKIYDGTRNPHNVVTQVLYPNSANDEDANTGVDFLSNGFKWRDSGSAQNGAETIIYAAWAEAPTVNLYGAQSNAR
jgi:hypothetical protein